MEQVVSILIHPAVHTDSVTPLTLWNIFLGFKLIFFFPCSQCLCIDLWALPEPQVTYTAALHLNASCVTLTPSVFIYGPPVKIKSFLQTLSWLQIFITARGRNLNKSDVVLNDSCFFAQSFDGGLKNKDSIHVRARIHSKQSQVWIRWT